MKSILKILILCISLTSQACADSKSEINAVNAAVSQIEKTINNLNVLELKLQAGEFEAVPPEVKYFYKNENNELKLLQVTVGHETFVTKYSYYFNNNSILKYLKETLHLAEAPYKQAILYKRDGSILWKNTDRPVLSSDKATTIFKSNILHLKNFQNTNTVIIISTTATPLSKNQQYG